MVEIIPFGRYRGLSVEQVALKDYSYFLWLLNNVEIRKPSLRERMRFVDHVGNNFVSQIPCALEGCENPANFISIYYHHLMNSRTSSLDFIYCSRECFSRDPKVTDELYKVEFRPLAFRSALSPTKRDTNNLIKIISQCMGIKQGPKSLEYLEEFFDRCQLRIPYSPSSP